MFVCAGPESSRSFCAWATCHDCESFRPTFCLAKSSLIAAKSVTFRQTSSAVNWMVSLSLAVTMPTLLAGKMSDTAIRRRYSAFKASSLGTNK